MAQVVLVSEEGHPYDQLMEFRSRLSPETNALIPDWKGLKFLVSRQYDIGKAVDMANQWAIWWRTPIVSGVTVTPEDMANGLCLDEDANEDLYRNFYPHSFQGVDYEQRPVYWEKIGVVCKNVSKVMARVTEDDLYVRSIRKNERLQHKIRENAENIVGRFRRIRKSLESWI